MWQPLSRVSDQRFQSQDLGPFRPAADAQDRAQPFSFRASQRSHATLTLPPILTPQRRHPLTKPSIAGTRHLPYAALAFCVFEACICSSFIQPHFRFPADTCLQRLRVPFSAGTVLPQPGAAEGRPVTHERLNFDFTSTRLAIVPLTSLS